MITDCQLCGACCFSDSTAYVPLTASDRQRLQHDPRYIHEEDGKHYLAMTEGHCVALRSQGDRFVCSLYSVRPFACRELERGTPPCREERREKRKAAERFLSMVAVMAVAVGVAACGDDAKKKCEVWVERVNTCAKTPKPDNPTTVIPDQKSRDIGTSICIAVHGDTKEEDEEAHVRGKTSSAERIRAQVECAQKHKSCPEFNACVEAVPWNYKASP